MYNFHLLKTANTFWKSGTLLKKSLSFTSTSINDQKLFLKVGSIKGKLIR